jgi:hypothetical protein
VNESRINLLKKYILEEPANPFNRYALAMEYYKQEPTIALTLLEGLLTEHPDYLPAYYKAAHLYWEKDEWDLAEQTFLAGIQLAEDQKDEKALKELKSAHLNFRFEVD